MIIFISDESLPDGLAPLASVDDAHDLVKADPTHGGKLHKKHIIDKTGRKQVVWVAEKDLPGLKQGKKGEEPAEGKGVKKDENEHGRNLAETPNGLKVRQRVAAEVKGGKKIAGQIIGIGKQGVTVKDDAGKQHQVEHGKYEKHSNQTTYLGKKGGAYQYRDEDTGGVHDFSNAPKGHEDHIDYQKKFNLPKPIPLKVSNVLVNPNENAKVRATWTDQRGRKQYMYSEKWTKSQKEKKFAKMQDFGKALVNIRSKVDKDISQKNLTYDRVNAAIVMLIDKAYFRVGSEKYAKENETYGASSLLKEHVKIDGNTVTFTFTGKRNVDQQKILTDPQIASTIKELMKLPGDQLFQCTSGHPLKGKGDQLTPLNNNDVNSYLKDYGFTAKDFRTYHATRICDEYLRASGDPKTMAEAKKLVNTAVNKTAEELGHTPAVCRNNYINPTIPEYFMWKGVKAEAETKKAKGKELKKGQEAPKWVGVGLTDDEKEFNKRLETIKQEMAEMEVEKNEGKFVDPDTESQNEGEEG